jgi:hypothetical protein
METPHDAFFQKNWRTLAWVGLKPLCQGPTTCGEKVSAPYGWQRYEEAILERDRSRLPVLIRAAHAAIDARMQQLKSDHHGSAEERQAILDALAGLRVLGRETNSN